MITKEEITKIVKKNIEGNNIFLVSVSIGSSGLARVYIDNDEGVTIKDCITLHKQIVNELGEIAEDLELQVSSPGINSSFRVYEQYLKNIGEKIEIITDDGITTRGTILAADKHCIEINEQNEAQKINKNEVNNKSLTISIKNIKSAKLVLCY